MSNRVQDLFKISSDFDVLRSSYLLVDPCLCWFCSFLILFSFVLLRTITLQFIQITTQASFHWITLRFCRIIFWAESPSVEINDPRFTTVRTRKKKQNKSARRTSRGQQTEEETKHIRPCAAWNRRCLQTSRFRAGCGQYQQLHGTQPLNVFF